MKVTVVTFPGSNCDADALRFFKTRLGCDVRMHWYGETTLPPSDLVVLPGGFSYGDYLRSGAMAARTPVMSAVKQFAERGGWVLGICNGFQILTESGLLPGALTDHTFRHFLCRVVRIQAQKTFSPWIPSSIQGQSYDIPIANAQGRYVADRALIAELEGEGQVAWRYEEGCDNGSAGSIAGVCDRSGRVMGMMPHPERTEASLPWLRAWLGGMQ